MKISVKAPMNSATPRRSGSYCTRGGYESGRTEPRSRFASLRRFFATRRFSRAALLGFVARRSRGTRSASRNAATSRSTASSRLRSWLRSSCATARRTGPARATTRRFWMSVNAPEASTSKTASTRLSVLFACWPPGPLDRDVRSTISRAGSRTLRVTTMPAGSSMSVPYPAGMGQQPLAPPRLPLQRRLALRGAGLLLGEGHDPALRPLFLVRLIGVAMFATFNAYLGLWAIQRLHASGAQVGLLYAAGAAAWFIFGPIGGALSDRVGRRIPLIAGLAGQAVV